MTAKKKASPTPARIRQATPPLVIIRTPPENHEGDDFFGSGAAVGKGLLAWVGITRVAVADAVS